VSRHAPEARQYAPQQQPQHAAILSLVVLDDTLFPKQYLLSAVLDSRFEPHITQPADHCAVVTHQDLALTRGVLRMLREHGDERAAMSCVLQGNKRAQDLVPLFLERLNDSMRSSTLHW
jgi:hypothetical protein